MAVISDSHQSIDRLRFRAESIVFSWAMMLTPPFPPLRNDEGVHEICKTWVVNYSTQFSRLLSRGSDYPRFSRVLNKRCVPIRTLLSH